MLSRKLRGRLQSRLSPAAVIIAIIALIAAAGGTAWATGAINGNSIKPGSIREGKFAKNVRQKLNAPGPVGPQGPQGSSGLNGRDGHDGSQGPVGPQGSQGSAGPQGLQGVQGPEGSQGAKGDTGAQGQKGDTGSQGSQGVKGDTGAQGTQGSQGVQGAQGVQGPQGPQGTKGDTGAQGQKGDTGSEGPQGPEGPEGSTGAPGPTGPPGPEGPSGEPATKTITATTAVTNWPESSGWATDEFSRGLTLTRNYAVPSSSCGGTPNCWFYTGTLADNGSFTTVNGHASPNTSSSDTISGELTGAIIGEATFEFYSSSGSPNAGLVPASQEYEAGVTSTTGWAKLAFPPGAVFKGLSLTAYKWVYSLGCAAQTWTDSINPGDDGQGAGDGNITAPC